MINKGPSHSSIRARSVIESETRARPVEMDTDFSTKDALNFFEASFVIFVQSIRGLTGAFSQSPPHMASTCFTYACTKNTRWLSLKFIPMLHLNKLDFRYRFPMPTFEYRCEDCPVEFEELLILREDVQKYSEEHPCPLCKKMVPRMKVTSFAFSFKGGVRGTSGVHGNSGVHDLDYPTLDKAVARSSEARWGTYRTDQSERDKVRKETGSAALTVGEDGKPKAADPATLQIRQKAIATFQKAVGSDKK